jgi:DNA gyrase subunit B
MSIIRRLDYRYNAALLEQLVAMPPMTEELLADEANLASWMAELQQALTANAEIGVSFKTRLADSEASSSPTIVVSKTKYSVDSEYSLPPEFFNSKEYQNLAELGAQLNGLLEDGAYIQRGEKTQPVATFAQAIDWLMDQTRRGLHIQRYKGLGEMNPDQLAETTMNPDSRLLLQVRIEDAVASDDVFSTLMGDEVEPRRLFIEQNALSVVNLDV